MGFIARESIKSSITSYVGFAIGIINIMFLSTKFLSPDQLGLTRVLQDSTLLFVSFAQIGTPFIVIKFLPSFYDAAKKHNGFLFFILIYAAIGFLIFTALFLGLKSVYLKFYVVNSPLLVQYFFYILPLVLGMSYINILESYILVYNKVSFPTFIREVFLKLANMAGIFLYAFKIISFGEFINIITAAYLIGPLLLVLYISRLKGLYLKPDSSILNSGKLKPIFSYGIFTFIGGLGYLLTTKIDIIMLPAFQGLTQTAIYSIAILIASIMDIPKRNIIKAVTSTLSFAIKENNFRKINEINKKSSNNLLVFGLLIFTLIWINIDNIFGIIPNGKLYSEGKIALFIFLSGRIADLFSGVNNEIILYSKYYNYSLVLIIFLAVLTVAANLIFIPLLGIAGAAVASTFSILVFISAKIWIVWKKFDSHPFEFNCLKAIFCFAFMIIISLIINTGIDSFLPHPVDPLKAKISDAVQIFGKTVFITLLFTLIFFKFRISHEFNNLVLSFSSRIKKFLL